MSSKPTEQDPQLLRDAAEAQLVRAPLTLAQPHPREELLHELRVHQIELEMQNDTLRQAQITLEESRDRYVDLYDFAPIGYLTLTSTALIAEVNLTGAALLGVERKKLLLRRFAHFVAAEDSDRWGRFFVSVLRHDGRQRCELSLKRGEGSTFHVQLDCLHMKAGGQSSVCIALTDITGRKHAEQQLRELSAHLQTVCEEEKASFARQIHDDLGGTLTALKMDTHWLARKLVTDKKMAPLLERVESMSGLIDTAVAVTRRVITELRPAILDDLGLLAALEWQSAQFHKRTGIECRVLCTGNEGRDDRLGETLSINLFRIFQEALTNAARHSGASRVVVKFQHGDEEVALSISDNGCGLPAGHTVAPISYGIRGMRERVEQLGGKIEFDSQPGDGFSMTVTLPLPADRKKEEEAP